MLSIMHGHISMLNVSRYVNCVMSRDLCREKRSIPKMLQQASLVLTWSSYTSRIGKHKMKEQVEVQRAAATKAAKTTRRQLKWQG